jgi:hypothetical protein
VRVGPGLHKPVDADLVIGLLDHDLGRV